MRRRPASDLSRNVFYAAVGLIAVHVVDDSFMQPQPGTSAGDHVFSGLIPLAILGLAAWAYPRVHGGEDDSGHRNPDYYRAAKEPKQIWEAKGGHTDGIDEQPQEYERRVVAFFDDALL